MHVTTPSSGWSQRLCCADGPRDPTRPTFLIRQVRGLDLRKLDRAQFTQFGRLIDKSFQMPREYQGMSAD